MEIKDRIINSAYEIFSTKGFDKTTIGEIIKKAECSKGGFYHHFKSKEEILEVIISNYVDDMTKHFNNIVANDKDLFIDKFNSIFMAISEYKLKQLKEWSKINNVFIFTGNDRILRQLEKEFKIAATGVYFMVLQNGKEQGNINVEYLEIFAELCTREILWIYEAAGKLINSNDVKEHEMFEKLLNFSEELISHSLGLERNEVKFRAVALSYLQSIKESYLAHKEDL